MKLYWSQKDSKHIKTGFVVSALFLRLVALCRTSQLKSCSRPLCLSLPILLHLQHEGASVPPWAPREMMLKLIETWQKSPPKKIFAHPIFSSKLPFHLFGLCLKNACQDTGHGTYFPQERTAFFMFPKVLRISKTSLVSPSSPTCVECVEVFWWGKKSQVPRWKVRGEKDTSSGWLFLV